jgi:DNA polymerase III subunit alpha
MKVKSVRLLNNGMSESSANSLFDKITNFAAYGFNRSHAVEYSVISYWCMWLKVHYPAEFYAAALSILNDDKLDGLVRDARQNGIQILPPDINKSTSRFEIVGSYLITPFNRCNGISEKVANAIVEARTANGGEFKSRAELEKIVVKRTVNSRHRETLDKVGAFANVEAGQLSQLDPSRRKDQMSLMPGLIVDTIDTSRPIVTGDAIKGLIIDRVIKPVQSCKGCSLSGGIHPIPLLGKKPKFMVITDCPNYSEESGSKMLAGKASNFLKAALASAGLTPNDGYFTSLVKSPKSSDRLTNEQINGCTKYLDQELEILKPPVIVALGASIIQYLSPGFKNDGDGVKIVYSSKLDANIIIGFNPAQIAFSPGKQAALDEVFSKVLELV